MESTRLVQELVKSFNALADEVQNLTDRKTILEHKLRYAHEQYQALADKYAPCAPDVAETIANLQIPPTPTSANFVPLPSRNQADSSQAQLAVFIRQGRRTAQQLSALTDAKAATQSSSRQTISTSMTSDLSTVLEKDFTVQGKKGQLQCPFSATKNAVLHQEADDTNLDPTPHHSKDPICAAMREEATSVPASNGASANKCPIRFMDKHSPEEIARYVETHKHELPRSHEVCLRRNQKNEDQIRKLDAKYGNLVSMIQDLSHLHAPMLPEGEQEHQQNADGASSNRRVSDWAQRVSASVVDGLAAGQALTEVDVPDDEQDLDRTGRFDRSLKEVRVGESPSRPWGISVPIPPPYESIERPVSPPVPVRMPSPAPAPADHPVPSMSRPSKCPFDHTKMRLDGPGLSEFPKMEEPHHSLPSPPPPPPHAAAAVAAAPTTGKQPASQPFTTPMNIRQHQQHLVPDSPPPSHQPAFLNLPSGGSQGKEGAATAVAVPQMVFNGPVFIGYPMEQAIQFMQHFQQPQSQ